MFLATLWQPTKQKSSASYCLTEDYKLIFVPGPGLEPGWVAPTVFETVASTDSAIRALRCKVRHFLWIDKK